MRQFNDPQAHATHRGEKFANDQALAGLDEFILVDSRRRAAELYRRSGNHWLYYRLGTDDNMECVTINLTIPVAAPYAASGV